VATPPSLKNIYKELAADVPGFTPPAHGNLEAWARQGVLLLNATLTVRAHSANSHAKFGWQTFTDAVVKLVNDHAEHVVFILWGGFAQKKGNGIISRNRHYVLEAAHPSPLSVTKFLGCRVFSKTNAFMEKNGKTPIDWTL
jgi:uracil-DNA glycosylase